MTNPGYEERLEVRLQSELDYYGEDMVVGSQGIRTIIDALADLRKQRDEAERLIEVGASNLYIIQSENERLAIENATLRAENERLTRERDDVQKVADTYERWKEGYRIRAEYSEAEAERLRKVLEDIAQQNLTREMPEPHDGDIPDGYDECIRVARAALTPDLSSKED